MGISVSESILRRLHRNSLVMQHCRMPVTKKMPGDVGNADCLCRGLELFERLVGVNRTSPAFVQKQPVIVARRRSPPPKLGQPLHILVCKKNRTTATVRFGRVELLSIYGTQKQVRSQSTARKRRASSSPIRTPLIQTNHTIVRYGSGSPSSRRCSCSSLGSNGSSLTGSDGNPTDRTGLDLRYPYFTAAAKMALATVLIFLTVFQATLLALQLMKDWTLSGVISASWLVPSSGNMLSQDNLISAPCRRISNRQNEGPVFVLYELCHCHHRPRFVVHIIQLRNNLGELPFGKRLRRKFCQTGETSSPALPHNPTVGKENVLPVKPFPARVVLAADTYISTLESLSGHEPFPPFVGPSNSSGQRHIITDRIPGARLQIVSDLLDFEAEESADP